MNNYVLVAAIAAATSGAASAQSNVQVYGLVDAGLEHVTNATPSGGGSTRVTTGGANNSRLGFRGSEDLGGGLKAVFNLEAGILLDVGASDGPTFRRQANVGVEGRLGRIVIGRSFTTVYDFINPFDPMGYAPRYSWAHLGSGTLANKYAMATAFDNMVKYQSTFGGLKVGASYGAGESRQGDADGRKLAAGAAYEMGGLRLAVTGERLNGTATAPGARPVTTAYHAAAAYQLGEDATLKLGYRHFRLAPAAGATARADTWWAGMNVQLTPVVDLTAVVYYQDIEAGVTASDTAADPMMVVLRAKYALSKRTSLYATAAHAKAQGGVPIGLSRDSTEDGGVTGVADHQSGLMLGLQHRF